jgi:hypothetical protein
MTKSGGNAPRKPATKFPQLQKQMTKNKIARNIGQTQTSRMPQLPKTQGRPRP